MILNILFFGFILAKSAKCIYLNHKANHKDIKSLHVREHLSLLILFSFFDAIFLLCVLYCGSTELSTIFTMFQVIMWFFLRHTNRVYRDHTINS